MFNKLSNIGRLFANRDQAKVSSDSFGGEKMLFHPGVLDYQKHTLLRLLKMSNIDSLYGKKILEIGGNGDMAVAKSLSKWSGERVTVVTPDPELHPNVLDDQQIDLILQGIENTQLPDHRFDLIYGCAILEHVLDYKHMFEECFRLLKADGHLLLQGGPLWYSRLGHHLFIVNNEMDYRFTENNPVPDFGHLYLTKMEMDFELSNLSIPSTHRRTIIQQIYDSEMLNRASIDDILDAIRALKWNSIKIQKDTDIEPGSDIMNRIQSTLPSIARIEFASNLYIAAQKSR